MYQETVRDGAAQTSKGQINLGKRLGFYPEGYGRQWNDLIRFTLWEDHLSGNRQKTNQLNFALFQLRNDLILKQDKGREDEDEAHYQNYIRCVTNGT